MWQNVMETYSHCLDCNLLLLSPSRGMEYYDQSVLSVCLCLSTCIALWNHKFKVHQLFCACCSWAVVMAWSSSHSIVIRYVLPVVWMTSCLRIMGPMVQAVHVGCKLNSLDGCTDLTPRHIFKLTVMTFTRWDRQHNCRCNRPAHGARAAMARTSTPGRNLHNRCNSCTFGCM